MADQKISELTALTGANVNAAADLLAIVDVSANETKKIIIDELRKSLIFPSFKAHKNGSDQTGIADNVSTQITFGTEEWDVGGFFASDAWTPPAGKVFMTARCLIAGTGGANAYMLIKKDGNILVQSNDHLQTGGGSQQISVHDVCTGSNVYTVWSQLDVTSGNVTVQGGTTVTFFSGHWLSA